MSDPSILLESFKTFNIKEIPKGWQIGKLSDFYTMPARNGLYKSAKHYGRGVAMIHMPQMFRGLEIDVSDAALVDVSPDELNRFGLKQGDLVFARRSLNLEGAGRCSIVPELSDPVTFESSIIRVRLDKEQLRPNFANYFLNSEIGIRLRLPFIRQVAVSGVSSEDVASIPILVPSIIEQDSIIELIGKIDSTIAHTSTLIAKLKQMKAGLLHDLLTRGLDENGKLRDAIEHPEQFKNSPLGQIPEDWDVGSFEKLADAIDPQPDHRAPPEVQDGKPYVGVGDFRQDGSIDFDSCRKVSPAALAKQQQRFRIEPGDIIFGKIGTIGLPRFLPQGLEYALNANTVLIKPKTCPSYVMSLLNSKIVEQQIQLQTHSTSQPAFGIQRIRAMLAPIPNESEQFQITAVLDSHEERIRTEKTYLNKLKEQKKGLMHDLLTGRVRVTDLKEIPS